MARFTVLLGLALVAVGSSAQSSGSYGVVQNAVPDQSPVSSYLNQRSFQSYPFGFYDKGAEALLASGVLPHDGLGAFALSPPPTTTSVPVTTNTVLPTIPSESLLQNAGYKVVPDSSIDMSGTSQTFTQPINYESSIVKSNFKPEVVESTNTVLPTIQSESLVQNAGYKVVSDSAPGQVTGVTKTVGQPMIYEQTVTKPAGIQSEKVTIRQQPLYNYVKKTAFVMAPKQVEYVERQVVRAPVIERQLTPVVHKMYNILPAPIVKKFFKVVPPPVVKKSYTVMPPPVIKKEVKVLPPPVIKKEVKVLPAPVVKKLYNVLPAPVVKKLYNVLPAPVVKKVYKITPPPVVERKVNVLPAPVIKKFYEVVPPQVIRKYYTPAPIVKKYVLSPPAVVKKYVVAPPPVLRKVYVQQQPVIKPIIMTPPAIVRNFYKVVKEAAPVVVVPEKMPEVTLSTEKRVEEVKKETKKEEERKEEVVTQAPLKAVEVEVPAVKTVGRVVLVETTRHVVDVDTFDKVGENAPAPTRSEQMVVDADGNVRKLEKYVVYDQVPYTQKIITHVPATAVEAGTKTFLSNKQSESSSSSSKSSLSSVTPNIFPISSTPSPVSIPNVRIPNNLSGLTISSTPSPISLSSIRSPSGLSSYGFSSTPSSLNIPIISSTPNSLVSLDSLSGPGSLNIKSSATSADLVSPSHQTAWRSSVSEPVQPLQFSTASGLRSSLLPSSSPSLVSLSGGAFQGAPSELLDEVTKQQILSSAARFEKSEKSSSSSEKQSVGSTVTGIPLTISARSLSSSFGPVESMTLSPVTPSSVLHRGRPA